MTIAEVEDSFLGHPERGAVPTPEQIFVAWPRWYNDGRGYDEETMAVMTEVDFFTPPPPPKEKSWSPGIYERQKDQITPKDYGILSIEVMAMNGGDVEPQRDGSIAIHWGIADGPDIAIVPLAFAPMVRLFKDYDKAMDYAQRMNSALYATQQLWIERAQKIVTTAKTVIADTLLANSILNKPPPQGA